MVETAAAVFLAMVGGLAACLCFAIFEAMLDSWGNTLEGWREQLRRERASSPRWQQRQRKRERDRRIARHRGVAEIKLHKARWMELAYHRGQAGEGTMAVVERLRQQADYEKYCADQEAKADAV